MILNLLLLSPLWENKKNFIIWCEMVFHFSSIYVGVLLIQLASQPLKQKKPQKHLTVNLFMRKLLPIHLAQQQQQQQPALEKIQVDLTCVSWFVVHHLFCTLLFHWWQILFCCLVESDCTFRVHWRDFYYYHHLYSKMWSSIWVRGKEKKRKEKFLYSFALNPDKNQWSVELGLV